MKSVFYFKLSFKLMLFLPLLLSQNLYSESPDFEFSGYLDSDVWTDFSGNFYTNDELDMGFSAVFSDKVSVNLYTTVAGGSVPAGTGEPGDRWVEVAFDGIDITLSTDYGKIAAGDLVYQYGSFDYYFYKRLSMITPESFARGVSWNFGNDMISQSLLIGASDDPDERSLVYHFTDVTTHDTVSIEAESDEPVTQHNSGTIAGATEVTFGDGLHTAGLYYSVVSDMKHGFERSGVVYSGLGYSGSFRESFDMKLDYAFTSYGGSEYTMGLLLEPSVTAGKFYTALSYYMFFNPDSLVGVNPVNDDMYVYLEPGVTLNDKFEIGLPLEIHSENIDNFTEASSFWAVPTFYIYPADGIEWWIWAQSVVPFAEDGETGYALGSEIIAEF